MTSVKKLQRLKHKDIVEYRKQQLAKQDNRCALCMDIIVDDAVLDHCHKSGLIRGVLHRGCNSLLGKIENNMPRNKVTVDRLRGLAHNLIEYITTTNSTAIHPTHRTAEEKAEVRKQKRRKTSNKNTTSKQLDK
jgi:hypothetical protein